MHIFYGYLFTDVILQTLRIARLFNLTKESSKVLFAVPQIRICVVEMTEKKCGVRYLLP